MPSSSHSGLDFEALLQRVHPAESRVRLLSVETPALLVLFDVLALGDDDLTRAAVLRAARGARRRWSRRVARSRSPRRPSDIAVAERWFSQFEGAGLDGIVAKDPDGLYEPGKRTMQKIKHERTADCVVAGYRPHKSGDDAVGSLLLGLYDDVRDARVRRCRGVVPDGATARSWSPSSRRWSCRWRGTRGTTPPLARTPREAAGSRWSRGKDLSFVPLEPSLVVEVAYDHMEGVRFRHTAQFRRWRPDRTPSSCTFEQLEEPVSYSLKDVLATS